MAYMYFYFLCVIFCDKVSIMYSIEKFIVEMVLKLESLITISVFRVMKGGAKLPPEKNIKANTFATN